MGNNITGVKCVEIDYLVITKVVTYTLCMQINY